MPERGNDRAFVARSGDRGARARAHAAALVHGQRRSRRRRAGARAGIAPYRGRRAREPRDRVSGHPLPDDRRAGPAAPAYPAVRRERADARSRHADPFRRAADDRRRAVGRLTAAATGFPVGCGATFRCEGAAFAVRIADFAWQFGQARWPASAAARRGAYAAFNQAFSGRAGVAGRGDTGHRGDRGPVGGVPRRAVGGPRRRDQPVGGRRVRVRAGGGAAKDGGGDDRRAVSRRGGEDPRDRRPAVAHALDVSRSRAARAAGRLHRDGVAVPRCPVHPRLRVLCRRSFRWPLRTHRRPSTSSIT